MNTPTDIQIIHDGAGNPAFVVMPYAQWLKQTSITAGLIPNEVVGAVIEGGKTTARAWREYLGLTQEEVSEKVGRSRPYIANMLRLLDLPEEVQDLLSSEKLTAGQARPLLGLGSDAEKISLARRIVKEGLSARQVEELARAGKPKKTKEKDPISEYLKAIEEKMGLSVGTKVRIRVGKGKNAHRGTISISFKNDEEFQRIAGLLDSQGK